MVLMAYLPEDDVERLLEKFPLVALTARTVTDERFFKERLKIVRSQGYAIEHGEVVDFLSNVVAPIRDYRGQVIAALSVPYVTKLKDKKAVELIITETVKTALAFSQSLGYVNNAYEKIVQPQNKSQELVTKAQNRSKSNKVTTKKPKAS